MQVSIFEGIKQIVKNTTRLKTKVVPLENAIGNVSAKTLKASISLPRFNNSAMDGYGLRGRSHSYRVVGKILAGDSVDIDLLDGECIKITTGAKTPKSIDRVIPQEDVVLKDNYITLHRDLDDLANIRVEGEDILKDKTIIEDGDTITSNYISLLASQGITHIEVYQKPRIALFASGSELKMPYEPLEDASIYNSNTPYLYARSSELGCYVTFVGKSKDSISSLEELIESSLDYDFIVTSGGVSVGEADFTKKAFSSFKIESIFDQVSIKPGKPTTCGKINKTVVLNLPGNPLAAALNYEIFGKIIINILSGKSSIYHNYMVCSIDRDFKKSRAVDTVVPGFYNGVSFAPARQFGANMVNVLNNCNGFIVVGANNKEIKSGDLVKFLPINWSFEAKDIVDFLS
jgi:molybdopterin molybdotransferase